MPSFTWTRGPLDAGLNNGAVAADAAVAVAAAAPPLAAVA
jgi:hypothetical protein